MPTYRSCFLASLFLGLALGACDGGGTKATGIDQFLPEIPPPTGEAQRVWAGVVTEDNAAAELIGGTAANGRVGDYYLRNERIRVVIGQPDREIAPQPYGGNILDADLVRGADDPYVHADPVSPYDGNDRFGEMGVIYVTGRTLDFTEPEILADGSGGGVAAIRFRGRDALNDFINLNGMGIIPIPDDILADNPQDVDGAVTYVLEPDAEAVRVLYTFYNRSKTPIGQPFGLLSDSGSEVELFVPEGTFGGVSMSSISGGLSGPAAYAVLAGPGVAYGLVPRLQDDLQPVHGAFNIEGVVIVLFNGTSLASLFDPSSYALALPSHEGQTYETEFYVATDAAGVEAAIRARRDLPAATVSGRVLDQADQGVAGARVYLFASDTGSLDDTARVVTFGVSDEAGNYRLAAAPGTYLAVAQRSRASRGAPEAVSLNAGADVTQDVHLAPAAEIHYVVTDASGAAIPARVAVIGEDLVPPDNRFGDTKDTAFGVIDKVDALYGSSESGSPADRVLEVPPGGPYRLVATRGPEWDAPSEVINPAAGPNGPFTLTLHHVIDTTGYVSSDFHQHSVNSPDSPVSHEDRVKMDIADGLEFFAATDHDFITDYSPVIERLDATTLIGTVSGVEATPFDYGHFNFYPLVPDLSMINHGAIDWGGGDGPGLAPAEIMAAYRDQRGAQVLQVNHPRSRSSGSAFQANFDRAALAFDFAAGTFGGDLSEQPQPNEVLRLPENASIFSSDFNVIEVWNGFGTADTNDDGVREDPAVDRTLRDWFNFLSLGFAPVGVADSDTHTTLRDPAMPRNLVRVPADTPAAIAGGLTSDVVDTLRRQGSHPGDAIMTSGPMIAVQAGDPPGGIGTTVTPQAGVVPLDITVTAPVWAVFDTVEIFVATTYDALARGEATALVPTACFTARTADSPDDTCTLAPLGGAQPLTVTRETTSDGGERWEAHVTFDLDVAQVPQRDGARSPDLWLVVRAFGGRGIFPMIYGDGTIAEDNLSALAAGDEAQVFAALDGHGPFALAITNPIFIDVDGGGYRAPFAP